MMNRRAFVSGLATVLAAPLAAEAQQAGGVSRVGALYQGEPSAPISLSFRESFTRGLREEGYVEGENITIEYRYGALDELLNAANDLIRLNVDVIIAGGTPAALAAKRATTTIPIVVVAMADPVVDGLVASLARPGANITGNTFLAPELGPKRLQLLREVVPGVTRIAALQQPAVYSERTMRNMLTEVEESAKASGVKLQVLSAKSPNDFEGAFAAMVKARAGALMVFPSPMFYVNYRRLVDLAAKHRLPTMYVFREAVEGGGLICYGANIPDLSRRAGKYAAKILKGAKPANLPIEAPTTFNFVINLKTAKALGLTIPPSLLLRADQVIE
jgi:putative tryptophan/tyrosine transport system substrate-binding protein